MATETATTAALFNALAWIDAKKKDAGVDTENVEVGVQCLSEAFGVSVQDEQLKRQFALRGGAASFEAVFAAGVKALGLELGSAASPLDFVDEDPVVKKNPDLWKKWVAKLEEKNFFNNAPVGSEEHTSRVKKALAKFKEKFGDVKKPAAAPSLSKEEKEAKAEEAKSKGNAALSAGDYKQAATHYEEALKLSSDGPNSHIYHSNLAAALTYLHQYSAVIDHAEQSIALKPSYAKAYSRMGHAYVQLKDYDGAEDAFRRGLEVDSANAACKDGLAEVERKRRQVQAPAAPSASSGGAGGMPDLSGLASMFGGGGGGGGGLADLMSNPALQQMASSMMQNPAMMQMYAQSLHPVIAAARSDPDLQEFFQDVDAQGPSAAMRHMSNPKVSQLMQSVMSGMQ
ncbi:hypothetical protein PybrP1_006117 [[Pythium] brassicae (nom. inval.)]|nr:hypothetical protein PybrP1_006117 [[Pythium] brassicae (nom. inval.)]